MNEHLFQAAWPITQTNRHTNTQTDRTDRIHSAYRTRLKSITSTSSQKLKKQSQCPFNLVQVKIREGSPEDCKTVIARLQSVY